MINRLLGLLILDLPLSGWLISGKVTYPFGGLLATSVSGDTNAQRPVVNLSPKPQPGDQAWCGARLDPVHPAARLATSGVPAATPQWLECPTVWSHLDTVWSPLVLSLARKPHPPESALPSPPCCPWPCWKSPPPPATNATEASLDCLMCNLPISLKGTRGSVTCSRSHSSHKVRRDLNFRLPASRQDSDRWGGGKEASGGMDGEGPV